ncbi:MAG: ABC transporter family substrate-binding protein [Bifidobacteriaceae bacterium]|jgi:peptide/nickel transport system substrate-binding protein|nr:ABC transporter family substrate-binding protein [Bifidobacteriaceae bacterium]
MKRYFSGKTLAVGALALSLSVAMIACAPLDEDSGDQTGAPTSSGDESTGVKDGGEAVFAGFISTPKSWNPLTAQGDTTGNRQAQWPFYPHVFYGDYAGALQLNTDLMESAEVTSEDPMTVVYKIKSGAVWSDGEAIDADDFFYTWSVQDPRQCADCTAAWTAGYDSMTLTASDDKLTVTAVFDTPFSMWKTLFITLLPSHVASDYGDLATSFNDGFVNNQPVVSGGPYVISEFEADVSLTMVKNEKWYGSPAHLDTIHYRYITSPSEVITAYQNGEVTIVYQNPSLETVEKANAIEGSSVEIASSLTYYHLIFKAVGDGLADAALRKAVAQAIDASDFVTRIPRQYDPEAPVLGSLAFAPGQAYSGYDGDPYVDAAKALNVGQGDVEGAKKSLADAGYTITDEKLHLPSGEALRPLTILTYSADTERMQMAEILNSQLKAIGIETTIDAADNTRYGTDGFAGKFDILITATASDLGVQALDQWYGTGKARNGSGYSSAAFDALVAEGNVALDPAEQIRILQEMDNMLLSEAIALPLYSIGNVLIHSQDFAGLQPSMSKYGLTWNINNWGYLR